MDNMIGSYGIVWRQRAFRWFWLGFSFSVIGDMMTRVALTWFVYETTGSAQALGWLNFFYTGPVIVGGFVAGWLLDRFDRRRVLLVDSLIRGAAVALIPLLHALGRLELWHIYLVAAAYGTLMMIALAGSPALVPDLVDKHHLATANALETLSYTLGGVIAPPIAGLLIARIGAPNVLILDVLSYLAFALALTQIRPHRAELTPDPTPTHRPATGFAAALRLFLGNRVLFTTTVMYMVANIGLGCLFVWLPVFADQRLAGGAELYGLLLGVMAVGEVISSVWAGSVSLSRPLGTMICLFLSLSGLTLLLFWLGETIWVAGLSLALFGLFTAPLTIWAQTLRMQIIPEGLRGRVFALLRLLMQGTTPIGGLLAGTLLPLWGLSLMIGFSALLTGLPGLWGVTVAELHQPEREPARKIRVG